MVSLENAAKSFIVAEMSMSLAFTYTAKWSKMYMNAFETLDGSACTPTFESFQVVLELDFECIRSIKHKKQTNNVPSKILEISFMTKHT